jgi:hypothetical protein
MCRAITGVGQVDEHVPCEKAVPRLLGDDADAQAVSRV